MKTKKKVQVNYRLPEALVTELREVAVEADVKVTAMVKQAVESEIRRTKRTLSRRRLERSSAV